MITVEDLLRAYASAYDAWIDPEAERKNPTPEYAELIRQAVSFENGELLELVRDMALNMGGCALHGNPLRLREFMARALKLGIEVPDA